MNSFRYSGLLRLLLFIMVFSIVSCREDGPDVINETVKPLFQVQVKDANGNPVKNLRVSVVGYSPFYSRAKTKQNTPQGIQSYSTIYFDVAALSEVDIVLYELNGTVYKKLADSINVTAGRYSLDFRLDDVRRGLNVHRCELVARDTTTKAELFRKSIYTVLWQFDGNTNYLGYTSASGELSSNDTLSFPHLYGLTNFVRTSEVSPEPIGMFNLSDSVRIILTDTTTGKHMSIVKSIGKSANQVAITWNPNSSSASEQNTAGKTGDAFGIQVRPVTGSSSRTAVYSSVHRMNSNSGKLSVFSSFVITPPFAWDLQQNFPNPFN